MGRVRWYEYRQTGQYLTGLVSHCHPASTSENEIALFSFVGMDVLLTPGFHLNEGRCDVLCPRCFLGDEEVGRDVVPLVATG